MTHACHACDGLQVHHLIDKNAGNARMVINVRQAQSLAIDVPEHIPYRNKTRHIVARFTRQEALNTGEISASI
jgi:hypothetical protein